MDLFSRNVQGGVIFDILKVRILQFGGSNNFNQKCSKKFSKPFFVISGVLASV